MPTHSLLNWNLKKNIFSKTNNIIASKKTLVSYSISSHRWNNLCFPSILHFTGFSHSTPTERLRLGSDSLNVFRIKTDRHSWRLHSPSRYLFLRQLKLSSFGYTPSPSFPPPAVIVSRQLFRGLFVVQMASNNRPNDVCSSIQQSSLMWWKCCWNIRINKSNWVTRKVFSYK